MNTLHINDADLALASSGDLAWRRRFEVWLHARQCLQCAGTIREYRRLRSEIRNGAVNLEMDGEAWTALEREMKANIGLGLSAGRIVDLRTGRAGEVAIEPAGWRLAVVMATLTVVLASGWLLRRPVPGAAGPGWGSVVAEASAEGVGIHEGQAGMILLSPGRDSSVMLAGTAGGARARFIDAETGQVTIHHVALED
jgi:hypothetical protein